MTTAFTIHSPPFGSEPTEPDARTATARLNAALLSEVLEQVDTGILVCTESARIVLANDAGRRELQRGQPVSVDAEGWLLVAGKRETAVKQCRPALRAAVFSQRRDLLALDDGQHKLMVAVTPLGRGGSAGALMLLGRRHAAPELAMELFGKLCDLTQAERAVLVALAAGERVITVARQRGVKIATVRTQVSALRAKLGAERVEDLVRMVAVLPPVTGALRAPPLTLPGLVHMGHVPNARPETAPAACVQAV
jgi:DNA-binding CsgD family transcriptional regulator